MLRAEPSFAPAKMEIPWTTPQIARKLIEFGESLCDLELYPYQYAYATAVIVAVLDRSGISPTALFSRQSGKTEVVSLLTVACGLLLPQMAKEFPHDRRVAQYAKGFWTGIYAPKDDQAKLAFDRVRLSSSTEEAKAAYVELSIQIESSRSDQVAWSSGSRVKARTASETSMSVGETWHLLILDESQDIAAYKIRHELLPMLTSTGGTATYIGTSGGSKGFFYRKIERNSQLEREDGLARHFESDYAVVVEQKQVKYEQEVERWRKFLKGSARAQASMLEADPRADRSPNDFHLNYRHRVDQEIEELGGLDKARMDEAFQLNYMLQWQDNRSIAIPAKAWEQLAVPNLELNVTGTKGFLVGGLDLAKGLGINADQTVLSILHVDVDSPILEKVSSTSAAVDPPKRYMKTLVGLYTFRGDFEQIQNDAVVQVCNMYPGLRYLVIDASGMGDPVASRMARLMPDIDIEAMSWHSVANKSMCYKVFLMDIRGQYFRFAAGPNTRAMPEYREMYEQVTSLQKKVVGGAHYVVCEAPEGEHDDYPDSLALAVYGAEQAVELLTNPLGEMESSDLFLPSHSNQMRQEGALTRADSYRRGRRGLSRYDGLRT